MIRSFGPGKDFSAVVELKQEKFYTYGVTLPASSAYSDSRGQVAVYEDG